MSDKIEEKRVESDSDHGLEGDRQYDGDVERPFITGRTLAMGALVGMGGLCWGFDTGQISGFQEMDSFRYDFGDIRDDGPPRLSELRTALIVALLSIGTLFGALVAGPLADVDKIGRKYSICIWCAVLSVGNAFQIAAQHPYWGVMLAGRIIAGMGVGGLSVLTPTFTSESAPSHIRGSMVSGYNLFVTFGQVIANLTNFGTNELSGRIQWRLPVGLGWVWCVTMGVGVLLFPETPRHDYRNGRPELARATMARYYGVPPTHRLVDIQIAEMQAKLMIEQESGEAKVLDIFTAPRMMYRILLGMAIQALQQLVGINFFMYFGTSLFRSVGIPNPFITACILGLVNMFGTFPGLYMVEKFGRRRCLAISASWQTVCFLIYASLGQFALEGPDGENDQTIGYLMIVFACLFIFSFAATWGPMAWTVIAEIYPSQYRSVGVSFACASNWIFNFYIAFSTSFVISAIGFAYGYFFAACNFAAALIVYFFLPETSGRSLEEIDTMFLLKVKPWKSTSWKPPPVHELAEADRKRLAEAGKLPSPEKDGEPAGGDAVYVEVASRV